MSIPLASGKRLPVLLALVTAGLVLVAFLFITAGPATAKEFATLHLLESTVEVQRGEGQFGPGEEGQTLQAGDTVRTGPDGHRFVPRDLLPADRAPGGWDRAVGPPRRRAGHELGHPDPRGRDRDRRLGGAGGAGEPRWVHRRVVRAHRRAARGRLRALQPVPGRARPPRLPGRGRAESDRERGPGRG